MTTSQHSMASGKSSNVSSGRPEYQEEQFGAENSAFGALMCIQFILAITIAAHFEWARALGQLHGQQITFTAYNQLKRAMQFNKKSLKTLNEVLAYFMVIHTLLTAVLHCSCVASPWTTSTHSSA